MGLSREQEALLIDMVEAERTLAPASRLPFHLSGSAGSGGETFVHPGWRGKGRFFHGDLEELAYSGLVRPTGSRQSFYVTNEGFDTYAELMTASARPEEHLVERVRTYFETERFRRRHPRAHEKWVAAEDLLWRDDSPGNQSSIGILCRDAIQLFATSLAATAKVDVSSEPVEKERRRLWLIVQSKKAALGEKTTELIEAQVAFLDALLGYWDASSGSVQRQVHGSQKPGAALVFGDARRVVLHTMIVMHELDSIFD